MTNALPVRVLVVDDHPIFARGIVDCLSAEPDIECVGAAYGADEALALIGALEPNVVILDALLSGTDAATVAGEIRARYPGVAMLAMSDVSLDYLVVGAIRAGVDGYLLKSCDAVELATAIRVVHRGESYLPPTIASKVVHHFRLLGRSGRSTVGDDNGLTDRELKVLELLVAGKSNREIAALFCLSERTVENHVHSVYRKLGVRGRTQAALAALQKGYVDLPAQQSIDVLPSGDSGNDDSFDFDRIGRPGGAVLAQNG